MADLTPQLHAVLSGLIRERLGIHYGPDDRELLADKIAPRLLDTGFSSLLDYYYHLRYDDPSGAELIALGDALAVNESYFFREHEHLELIASEIVAPAIARGERPRVWSAACAAGEEPLSLAMILAARGLLDRTELVASDMSRRALARAADRTWTRRALRTVPDPTLVARYLEVDDAGVRIARSLVDAISWRALNLMHAEAVAAMGSFDAILCRNVLIYFDDATVREVVSRLTDRLRPDGVLFVGVSESLLRFGTSLVCEERGGVFCYRKAAR